MKLLALLPEALVLPPSSLTWLGSTRTHGGERGGSKAASKFSVDDGDDDDEDDAVSFSEPPPRLSPLIPIAAVAGAPAVAAAVEKYSADARRRSMHHCSRSVSVEVLIDTVSYG